MSGRSTLLGRKPAREPGGTPLEIVIAGGGVAALEAALGLHVLAGDRVKLTIVAPNAEFVYEPVAVLEPFVNVPPRRLALAKLAGEIGATLEQASAAEVDCDRRLLLTSGRQELRYDVLVLAIGVRSSDVLPGAIALDVTRVGESLQRLIDEIDAGAVRSLAFVAPRSTWPLPVYELALLADARARERSAPLEITVVTAEREPLDVFGDSVSAGVAGLLAEADISLIAGASVHLSAGKLIANPGERELRFDRVVALPELNGPALPGLPADAAGFLPATSHGAVRGVDHVYAVGDATDFPVKFGGIAARQADAAAESIAALAGALAEPASFDGIVHGVLLTGREAGNLYFTARIEGGLAVDSRISRASENPTWSPEAKIDAKYLGAYLDELWQSGPPWRRTARPG